MPIFRVLIRFPFHIRLENELNSGAPIQFATTHFELALDDPTVRKT